MAKLSRGASLLMMIFFFAGLSACGPSHRPAIEDAVIENTEGGEDLLEREFVECSPEEWRENDNPAQYVYQRGGLNGTNGQRQRETETQFPHQFSSLGQMYPDRGTWRQSKAEILDLVDRHLWSPEQRRVVQMLHYFDMVLLINVAPRPENAPSDFSAQRMQVLVRQNDSNNLADWRRIHTWPISSGIPCGKKIETFTGVYKFNPQRFYSDYRSNLWDGVEMYESMFLYHRYRSGTNTGVAIHGTYLTQNLGKRDSGGCIRVYRDNSQCLFNTITGRQSRACLDGGLLDYWGKVPSFLPTNGEADPEYTSSGQLEVDGYRVLVALYNQENDRL